MKAIDRKLLRDLAELKGQMLAICLVIACGVATFVMSLNTLRSLEGSQQNYYRQYRFGEVFCRLKRAPRSLARRIQEIPGVAVVQTRVKMNVNLDVQGMNEPALGRLISIPETREPKLNALHLRRGRTIAPHRPGEVMVSQAFAEAHSLRPGDTVDAIMNGSKETLTIVGIVNSPEYVYELGGNTMFPDNRHFGVFWMGYQELASAFNMEGGFNDVSLTLIQGASLPQVLHRLDLLMQPYGGLRAYGRADQISNRFLSDEIAGLRGTGMIVPIIFLSVAGFLLNVVLSRLISTQREQIAALKAFGYTNLEVGLHYLKLVLLVSFIGAVLGVAVGIKLGMGLTQLYGEFYRIPHFDFVLRWQVVFFAFVISGLSALLSVLGAVNRAVRLPPAEAMRPEPPATFRRTFIERLGLQKFFSNEMLIILRQIDRRPFKSLISCLGIAVAMSVLVLGRYMWDAIAYMVEFEFTLSQRQDITVTFVEPRSSVTVYDLQKLPGVLLVEPMHRVPVRLVHENHNKRISITGVSPGYQLNRRLDAREQPVAVPHEGILLSRKLAEILGVKPSQSIEAQVLTGHRPVAQVMVRGVVEGYTGISGYMSLAALNRLAGEGDLISGALLRTDPLLNAELYQELKQKPLISNVNIKEMAIQSFKDTIAENMTRMNTLNVIFACIIACGVVYNIARISLSERSRELATLRVIGFTRFEVSSILLGELAMITLLATPLGLSLGYGFAWLVTFAYNTELYRIPLVIDRSSYAFAVTVVFLATSISGLIVRRKLDHLELVSVLKSKD